ncbi:MAG: hypothetical protein COW84_10025 [Gammaproteobacteria bacterium CG22_combo_CG10-13_8_21_14_all_40_8]|nr:MAG: hypothetical protein COW84_10025 [Gammaproteobacteria bacterium CG22_combo_CG10-13_8_21_14_all_40_8]
MKQTPQPLKDYQLLDCGDFRRLERFADWVVDRPAPQAHWRKKLSEQYWNKAQAYYIRNEITQAWSPDSKFPENWQVDVKNFKLQLKPSPNNQLGIFPEQLDNWRWIKTQIESYQSENQNQEPLRILNGFAYTGAATLAASSTETHVEVTHVDAAKASVNWAKQNALISGFDKHPIRWIVDDILIFLEREIKRKNHYDGFILDPPAFGRSGKNHWDIKKDLSKLIQAVNELLSNNPSFVILSCHAPELSSLDLANMLENLQAFKGRKAQQLDLIIPSLDGNSLPSSICARI